MLDLALEGGSGLDLLEDGPEHWSWSGSASFGPRNTDQPGASGVYPLATGSVTYTMTFTGNGPGRFGGCSAQGSVTKQLTDPDWTGWLGVSTSAADGLSPPYEYGGTTSPLSTEAGQMSVTQSACPNPDDNGKTAVTDIPPPLSADGASPDGLTYKGSHSVEPTPGTPPIVWHWDFHGETE